MDEDDDPTKVYKISPGYMEQMIEWYLTPVINKLGELRDGYTEAGAEVRAAHGNETPGWFGGEGNGEVKAASSSFLSEVSSQLEQLVADQSGLASSLTEYRAFLLNHADWARKQDQLHADRFAAIQRELEGFRWS
ncbi:hypothetical protein [Actinophytocola sediminis]